MIELATLGRCTVRYNGTELEALSAHKQKCALLVYLALEGPVSRDHLLGLFWPEREEEKARHSLSQALYALRRELSEECFDVRGDQVSLASGSVTVDAKQLEEAAEAERWDTVTESYQGPFLDHFVLPGAPGFEDWQSRTRNRLSRLADRGFRCVIEQRRSAGDRTGALATATRWAAADPLEDEAHHTLIALLADSSERTAALEHFEAYRERLSRELEVEPLDETLELVERIRAGDTPGFKPLTAPERPKEVPQVRELVSDSYLKGSISERASSFKRSAQPLGWRSLLSELHKRRVLHVALVYAGAAWVVMQVADILTQQNLLPSTVFTVLLFFLIVGFPFAVILAWAQEQQAAGAPQTGARATTGPWPRWFERVRGGHVLAVLSALLLTLVVVLLTLNRGIRLASDPAGASVTLPEEKRLVVLPFSVVGDDPSVEAFGIGLVETITRKLTSLEQPPDRFIVMPRRDMLSEGIASVGDAKQYGNNLAVTGNLIIVGQIVRLSLSLFHAERERELLSMEIDEVRTNIDDLPDRIVVELADMLDLGVRELPAAGGTTVPGAYDFYLQGRGYLARYEDEENIDHALELFERAVALDPSYALAYAGLGEAWLRKYDLNADADAVSRAQQNAEHAIELNDQLPEVHVTLGLILNGKGGYEPAVAHFKRALELDSASADGHKGLAEAYEDLGRLDEAESTYQRAIELNPGYWGSYNALGVFYYFRHRFADAVVQFRRVTELTPDNPRGYSNLGAMYDKLQMDDSAVPAYEKAIALKPTADAYTNLAVFYWNRELYMEAATNFEKATELAPTYFVGLQNLAAAYYSAGEHEKALAAYDSAARVGEQLLMVNPRDPYIFARLADCYARLGQAERARTYIEQMLALAPDDPEIMFRAGDVYEMLGDRDQALEWIAKSLETGYPIEEVEHMPGLADLRADPRYEEMIRP